VSARPISGLASAATKQTATNPLVAAVLLQHLVQNRDSFPDLPQLTDFIEIRWHGQLVQPSTIEAERSLHQLASRAVAKRLWLEKPPCEGRSKL
jgi:hypothetical protein